MSWEIEYHYEALNDLKKLDVSQKIQVLKAIEKVSKNPLSKNEGGYGKPLGNHSRSRLSGFFKIKLKKLGIRVVYGLVKEENIMKIVIISLRADDTVYKLAKKRIK